MVRSLRSSRVVVSIVVAFMFVGFVVAAGAVFRDRHAPERPRRPVAATLSPPRR